MVFCSVLLLGAILSISADAAPPVTARLSRPCAWEGLQVARLAREDCVWQNVCMGLVKAEHVQIYQMLLEWETRQEPRAIYGPRDAGSEVIVSLIVG